MRAFDGQDAGQDDAGLREAVRQAGKSDGTRRRQVEARRAGGGDDDFRTGVESAAGVVERVDRGFGLEVQVARQSTRCSMCRKNAATSWTSSCGIVCSAAITDTWRATICPCPRIALACVSSSCGRCSRGTATYRSLPIANSSGCTPAASTACTACTPGSTVGMIGPVSSWMNCPKIVSSCGGRPTTVNGQMAPCAVIHLLDAQHREVVLQAVVAEMVAERPFGQRACSGSTVPQMQKSASA